MTEKSEEHHDHTAEDYSGMHLLGLLESKVMGIYIIQIWVFMAMEPS